MMLGGKGYTISHANDTRRLGTYFPGSSSSRRTSFALFFSHRSTHHARITEPLSHRKKTVFQVFDSFRSLKLSNKGFLYPGLIFLSPFNPVLLYSLVKAILFYLALTRVVQDTLVRLSCPAMISLFHSTSTSVLTYFFQALYWAPCFVAFYSNMIYVVVPPLIYLNRTTR